MESQSIEDMESQVAKGAGTKTVEDMHLVEGMDTAGQRSVDITEETVVQLFSIEW
jgi:hypothetical protein